MRSLRRNERTIWYSTFVSSTPIVDEWGNETGETDDVFTDPPGELRANISAASGQAAAEAFGAFTDYSRVISTCDMDCPLAVGSRVWFGVGPSPEQPHNYIVVRRADSINSILIALKEVTVTV